MERLASLVPVRLYEVDETTTFGEDGEQAIEGGGELYNVSQHKLGFPFFAYRYAKRKLQTSEI